MVGPFASARWACAGDANQRRAIASDLVDVTARTWRYLGEGEGYVGRDRRGAGAPGRTGGLGGLARWSDEGIVSLPRNLGMVLRAAVAAESMSTALATALSYLTGTLERALLESILDAVNGSWGPRLHRGPRGARANRCAERRRQAPSRAGSAGRPGRRGTWYPWLTQPRKSRLFTAKELDDPEVTEAQANAPVTSFRDRSVRLALASSERTRSRRGRDPRRAAGKCRREAEKGAVERYYEDDVFEAMREWSGLLIVANTWRLLSSSN